MEEDFGFGQLFFVLFLFSEKEIYKEKRKNHFKA